MVVSHFWQKRWFGIFPILSYVCPIPFMVDCFYDVAGRAEIGDIEVLLDVYPGIANGFLLLFGVITVMNVIALFLTGKGRLQ